MLDIEEFRAIPTSTGLTPEYSKEYKSKGYLDCLQISIDQLRGKKILDVGCGGGSSVKEALSQGLDYYGVDIIPAINTNSRKPPNMSVEIFNLVRIKIKQKQTELSKLIKEYPDRIIAVDAGKSLPFRDDSFDFVLSHLAMPGYTRNMNEVVISLLEMIRVAKGEVIFSGGWDDENEESNGLVSIGVEPDDFYFPLKSFLEDLKEFGINYKLLNSRKFLSTSSLHIDISKKNNQLMNDNRTLFVSKYSK